MFILRGPSHISMVGRGLVVFEGGPISVRSYNLVGDFHGEFRSTLSLPLAALRDCPERLSNAKFIEARGDD